MTTPKRLRHVNSAYNAVALREALAARNDPAFREGDVHQAILNLIARKREQCGFARYADAVGWALVEYGPLAAFALLSSTYDGEVINGGHTQYYDNGFAGERPEGLVRPGSLTLHKKMLSLFEVLDFHTTKLGKQVYENALRLRFNFRGELVNVRELDLEYAKLSARWRTWLNNRLAEILAAPTPASAKSGRRLRVS